jgi:hypothetical protein
MPSPLFPVPHVYALTSKTGCADPILQVGGGLALRVRTNRYTYLAMRPVRLELLSDVLGHVMPCKDADELVRVYRPVLAFSPEESRCLVHRFSQMRAQLLRSADPDRRARRGTNQSTPWWWRASGLCCRCEKQLPRRCREARYPTCTAPLSADWWSPA